jgi:hypothetical protein
MITKRRMFYASLVSAAVFLVVLAIAFYIDIQTLYQKPDGSPDNAPARAVGVLILISPALFVVFAAIAFAAAVLLQQFKQLRPLVLGIIVSVVSIGLSLLMAIDRPFGWRDVLYYFLGFAGFNLATLGLSAFVWWIVAARHSARKT